MLPTQAPNAVVMIRPWRFGVNPETAQDNAFQQVPTQTATEIAYQARMEFDGMVTILKSNGIHVHVFEDYGEREIPDCVFPNNWFSTHSGGHVAVYPMFSPKRRRERRADVIDMLKDQYRVQEVTDYSGLEKDGLYLEGTGAMVLDHLERVAYTANSNRANPIVLERFCSHLNFEPMAFDAVDENGKAVYHTNVMMCITSKMVLICSSMIKDKVRRAEIIERLSHSGRQIIDLNIGQIKNFAANALELTGAQGSILALSQRAYNSLTTEQSMKIEPSTQLVPINVPTIELSGGSVRCMLAGIHLTKR